MARRALLIGSETFGLTGCDADVALMGRMLGERGFDPIATLTGEKASCDAIVDAFESLIGALPDGTRAALRLRFVEDLDYDRIAARLGCSPVAARQRVSTAIRTLRNQGIAA